MDWTRITDRSKIDLLPSNNPAIAKCEWVEFLIVLYLFYNISVNLKMRIDCPMPLRNLLAVMRMFWPDGCAGVREIDRKSLGFCNKCIDEFLCNAEMCVYVYIGNALQSHLAGAYCLCIKRHPARYEVEYGISPRFSTSTGNNSCYVNEGSAQVAKSSPCQLPSPWAAPICRQFWKAGNSGNEHSAKTTIKNGNSQMHIHPEFLHSNATSHKWVFGDGNGFKTSSMRLGSDVIVFTRHSSARGLYQSVGLLSYTFKMSYITALSYI
ncbi:hypothetical protein POM88_022193 [Heracleum sosnowskyi]|uniref:Uncharacterized protein n=1 Tax=Heracleum sosnowskyi TaxID=360622 RepID=A0AAD8IG05_9APIA|nr:hypothetical protein POM88_022193 [Heracleum sosnowskyi]